MHHQHAHEHEHAPGAEAGPRFRFEDFADAPSAKAAFEAAYPLGSPAAPALQALVDMGAHCKAVSQAEIDCRYVEHRSVLTNYCWHVAVQCSSEKAIQGLRIGLATTGT